MRTTIEYPIDDKSQVKNHQDAVGLKYNVSGNLFIVREVCKTVPKSFDGARSSITAFSNGSAVRMRRYLRECRPDYRYMVTLTYPCGYSSDGQVSKNHLRRFCQEVQREFKRDSTIIGRAVDRKPQRLSLFWFLEFQERGAPHYHILCTHWINKDWVAKRWYEIVFSEDLRHLHAGTRCEQLRCGKAGTIKYAIKYANKQTQKVVPIGYENVGRFWGVYGDKLRVSADIFISRMRSKDPDMKGPQERLNRLVERFIANGFMAIMVREEGVFVGQIIGEGPKNQLMMRINMCKAMLPCHEVTYTYEELDEMDEEYHADKML